MRFDIQSNSPMCEKVPQENPNGELFVEAFISVQAGVKHLSVEAYISSYILDANLFNFTCIYLRYFTKLFQNTHILPQKPVVASAQNRSGQT